jgi:hypothetical protein
MQKGLLALGALFAICLSMLATDMVVKQKNGEDWKINVDDVEEVFFEEKANIPDDSIVVDTSETFLRFNILSDSTVEVTRESDNDYTYLGHDSITIPEKVRIDGKVYTVTSIGRCAFAGCVSVTNINIPKSVTDIGELAFSDCLSLTSIEIPEGVTYIAGNAFCRSLEPKLLVYDKGTKCYGWLGDEKKCTEVVIPEGVTSIGAGAFSGCSGLTNIDIPEGVTSIGASAFYYCSSLDVVIDNSKDNVKVGKDAFYRCKSVTWLKE